MNDKLSPGAGINGMDGMFDQKVAINNALPSLGDGCLEIDDRWALMGNVGWQDWSEFGGVEIGIDNTQDPASLTNPLSFDDTWHVAVGAQYRPNDQWKVSLGLACDSGFQDGNDVSPMPPVLGGRGNLVGGFDQTPSGVLTVYGNWAM